MAKTVNEQWDGSLEKGGFSSYRFGIVVSNFNPNLTTKLLNGALETLEEFGVERQQVAIFRVPGAFEIPSICKQILLKDKVDALITLGAVIRGGTPHFDYVCQEASRGIMEISLAFPQPISFGVLTCDDEMQAFERAGGLHGNKGSDCVRVVLELLKLKEKVGL